MTSGRSPRPSANGPDSGEVDLILTTGGTGLGPRDVTPEATLSVIERQVPGIPEAMRLASMEKTPMGMISRQVAGAKSSCLIVNLPGSPKAVRECLDAISPVLVPRSNPAKRRHGSLAGYRPSP